MISQQWVPWRAQDFTGRLPYLLNGPADVITTLVDEVRESKDLLSLLSATMVERDDKAGSILASSERRSCNALKRRPVFSRE